MHKPSDYIFRGWWLGAFAAFAADLTIFLLKFDAIWVGVVITLLWIIYMVTTVAVVVWSDKDE